MALLYYVVLILLTLGAVSHLLLFKREPSSTIAWLVFVILVPFAGPLIFFIFGPQRLEGRAIKRKREIDRMLPGVPREIAAEAADHIPSLSIPDDDKAVFTLARRLSDYCVAKENHVEILNDPNTTLSAMQEAIAAAKSFIHVQYYIIEWDEVTSQLFEHLEIAARRGVEVRILYDSVGSLYLKRRYFKRLIEAGAKIAGFLPFSFFSLRWNVNFRNHRKILVVDGDSAFTGGTNLGRNYLGRLSPTQWHDYSIKLRGPVAVQLNDVFAKDWQFTTQEDLYSQQKYYPSPGAKGDSLIQVLESGPDSVFQCLHQALFLALSLAKNEILLTTPYFVPDPAIISVLTVAALRGVAVTLLLPHKSDLWLVQYASRSFFDDLLAAGISIYEYEPRILHAKLLTIDRTWSMLGSANMDIRSFRLNFELNVLIHGAEVADQARALFLKDLKLSHRIDRESFSRRPISQQILENACRLLSPIL